MLPFLKKSVQNQSFLRLICYGFLFFMSFSSELLAENKKLPIGDISKKWYVYSPAWKTFLPYVPSKHFSYQSKSLLFEGQKSYGTFLQIEPQQEYHLFVNGVYQSVFHANKTYWIGVDSLVKRYPASKYVVFTLYSNQLRGIPDKVTQMIQRSDSRQDQEDLFTISSRPSSVLNNFFINGTLLVIFIFALIYRYFPRNFTFFFRYRDWITFTYKEDAVVKTIFSFPNLMMLFCLCLLTGYLAFYNAYLDPTESETLKLGGEEVLWGDAVLFILKKSGLAFVLFLGRYFVYVVFTSLFKIEVLATPHFIKSVQTNIQFFSLLYFVLFFLYLIGGASLHPALHAIDLLVNLYFLIRMIYFFFLFKKTFHLNTITLLAYLLFMEGQVVIFGIRQLIFPNYL